MNMAQRIQTLRKQKGLSQEELAEALAVSRQAVSKWESEQSLPDVDKIVLLSDYFAVSTDYLLKGTQPPTAQEPQPAAAAATKSSRTGNLVLVATALDFVALVSAACVWHAWQNSMAFIVWAVLAAGGCTAFAMALNDVPQSEKQKLKNSFWVLNVWLLAFVPLALFYTVLACGVAAPYPLPYGPMWALPLFWLVYVGGCLAVNFKIIKEKRKAA